MKFNITADELKKAYEYAIEHGKARHKTITMRVESTSGIGDAKLIHKDYDASYEDFIDVTNYGSW